METPEEIAKEYLKEFDRYYLPEQEKELADEIKSYVKEHAIEFAYDAIISKELKFSQSKTPQKVMNEFYNKWIAAK